MPNINAKPTHKALTFKAFPAKLIHRAKVRAAERGISLKALVIEALEEVLARKLSPPRGGN